jgi:plastocyanin
MRARPPILAALLVVAAASLPPVAAHAAPAVTVPIGVDHAPPVGHDFEYTDFLPRGGTVVHQGDVLDFAWAASPDGLHTATVLATGTSPEEAGRQFPLVVGDGDDGPAQAQVNPAVLAPSNPACGSPAAPCAYDGTTTLNSGAFPTDGRAHFAVRLDAAPGTTIRFLCLIHPGMSGSVTVAGPRVPRTPLPVVHRNADRQAAADTRAALAAERAADHVRVRRHHDGTRTVTLTAGTAAPHVEVAEMLPRTVHLQPGDRVRWVTRTRVDIHTVTFPRGTDQAEALPAVCEDPVGDDPAGPPPPCAGDPSRLELHFDPQPVGPGIVPSPDTVVSSGILGARAGSSGLPSRYALGFPNRGTFSYFCHVHEHGMVGSLIVG